MTLAGLLEIADREFEAIQQKDAELRETAVSKISAGMLSEVEITPDALSWYLASTIGADERISDYSYEHEAKVLKGLGFTNFEQIEECIHGLNDDHLSRFAYGTRSGQISRFDVMLLAAMGEYFIENHTWNQDEWYRGYLKRQLEKLKEKGVTIGSYRPQ